MKYCIDGVLYICMEFWMGGWMMGCIVLMEYCIYCSGVFVWVDEWMDEVFVLMYCIIVVEYLDGWMDEWMRYLY